jgi:hypothetical protein
VAIAVLNILKTSAFLCSNEVTSCCYGRKGLALRSQYGEEDRHGTAEEQQFDSRWGQEVFSSLKCRDWL